MKASAGRYKKFKCYGYSRHVCDWRRRFRFQDGTIPAAFGALLECTSVSRNVCKWFAVYTVQPDAFHKMDIRSLPLLTPRANDVENT